MSERADFVNPDSDTAIAAARYLNDTHENVLRIGARGTLRIGFAWRYRPLAHTARDLEERGLLEKRPTYKRHQKTEYKTTPRGKAVLHILEKRRRESNV